MSNQEPTIEQIMRCHRLMMEQMNRPDFASEKSAELNELERICGPYDWIEILHSAYIENKDKLRVAVDALENFVNTFDHRGAIASYPMRTVDKARQALEEIKSIEK